jgi:hypothetical protein
METKQIILAISACVYFLCSDVNKHLSKHQGCSAVVTAFRYVGMEVPVSSGRTAGNNSFYYLGGKRGWGGGGGVGVVVHRTCHKEEAYHDIFILLIPCVR